MTALAEDIARTAWEPLIILDEQLHVVAASQAFLDDFHCQMNAISGQPLDKLDDPLWQTPALLARLRAVLADNVPVQAFNVDRVIDAQVDHVLVNAHCLRPDQATAPLVLVTFRSSTPPEPSKEQAIARMIRTYIDNAPDIAAFVTPEGTILYINQAVERVLGYPPQAVIDHSILDYIHPDDRESIDQHFAQHVDNPNFSIADARIQHRDGSWRHIEVKGNNLAHAPNTPGIVISAYDITERWLKQEQLQASESKLRTLFAAMCDLVIVIDREGRQLEFLSAVPELLYKPVEEQTGKTLHDIFPAPQADGLLDTIQRALKSRQAIYFDYSLLVDEREIWLSASVSPLGEDTVLWVARDISAHKEIENALHTSEERYALAVSVGKIGYLEWELSTGEMYVSPEFRLQFDLANHALKYTIADWINRIHPDDVKPFYQQFEALLQGQIDQFESEIRAINTRGYTYWVLVRLRTTLWLNGKPGRVTGAAIDITDRKLIEETLRDSEERFRQLAENIEIAFWLFDNLTKDMIYVNPAYEVIQGIKSEEIYRDAYVWLSRVHPDDRERMRATISPQESHGAQFEAEFRLVMPNGEIRWIREAIFPISDEQGRIIRIAGFAENITGRKQAEEYLRQSEERFAKAFQASPIAISIARLDNGYIAVNESWLRLCGYTRDEVLGRLADELNLWVEPAKRAEIYQRVGAGESIREQEIPIRTKSGDIRSTSLSADLIFLDNKKHILVLARDITEHKLAEKQALELAVEREKTKFLETLLADTSHDLRTPITVLRSSTYLLSKYTEKLLMQAGRLRSHAMTDMEEVSNLSFAVEKLAANAHDQSRALRDSALHLQRLIESLFDMVRLDRGIEFEFKAEDLNLLVHQASETQFLLAAEKHIIVRYELGDLLPPVWLDEGEFSRVVQNLAENAVRHTPPKGKITLRTYLLQDNVVFEVSDTGTGIPQADLPYIFDHFYKADKARSSQGSGMGLGLTIAKKIVTAHHGRIEVSSTEGQGSTFRVLLPLTRAHVQPA